MGNILIGDVGENQNGHKGYYTKYGKGSFSLLDKGKHHALLIECMISGETSQR